ncbi:MAG: hypothetical protein H0X24_03645 [Ktedonobacterales bacterium]|nr:hypothetical protein [Ktedonobacterales bacterium]
MTPARLHTALIGVAAFAALSAIGGGIGLMATNSLGIPLDYLRSTPFTTYFMPGVILSVVVGGSALAATLLLLRHQRWADLTAFGAGAIMAGWIVVEVLMLGQLSWLQWFYLVVGVTMMGLAIRNL